MSNHVSSNGARFLGMTKVGALSIAIAVLSLMAAVTITILAMALGNTNETARQAALQSQINERRAIAAEENLRATKSELALVNSVFCAMRNNTQIQIEQSSDFLAHNAGDPIKLGDVSIPRSQIIDQLERQRAFRDTMTQIQGCPSVPLH